MTELNLQIFGLLKLFEPQKMLFFLPLTSLAVVSLEMNRKCGCLVAKLCLTLCNLMDCSLPGSSVHGILQGRMLEWVLISFSGGSSRPGIEPASSALAGGFFTTEPSGKPE